MSRHALSAYVFIANLSLRADVSLRHFVTLRVTYSVLVYAFAANDARSERAEQLLDQGGVVSVQVMNEFVSVMRRKLQRDWAEIGEATRCLRVLLSEPLPLTMATHDTALRLARERGLAFCDGLIVAAALQAKCPILCTEDLHDGLTIRNPFAIRLRAT